MIRKRLLSFAVAAALAAAGTPQAFADVAPVDTLSGDVIVGSFFTKKSDAIEFKSGDSYTIKFHSKNVGTNNWDNFSVCFATAAGEEYTGDAQEAVVLRADNYSWNGKAADFGAAGTGWSNTIDWDNFLKNTQAGFDASIDVSRDGNSIKYIATYSGLGVNGTDAYDVWRGESTVELPESLYIFISGENAEITGLSSEKKSTDEDDDGVIDQHTWWSEWTPTFALKDGETLNISFEQQQASGLVHCSLDAIFLYQDLNPAKAGYSGSAERVALRSDNYGWGPGWDNEKVEYTSSDYLYHGDDFDYKEYLTGAKYDVEVTKNNTIVDYVINFTSGTGEKAVYSYRISDIDDKNYYVFFTFDAGAKWTYKVASDNDPGDVNGDGKINIKDVMLIQQSIVGWKVDIDETAADVNKDGKVNIKDVMLIQQYIVGWNVTLK